MAANGLQQQQQQGAGMSAVGGSSSSLDGPIIQVVRQAVLLPGLASHLIRSSGLLSWLAAAAAAHIQATCSSSGGITLAATAAAAFSGPAATASGAAAAAAAAVAAWHNAAEGPVFNNSAQLATAAAAAAVPGGSWALDCLVQLLSARVGLNIRKQAASVFEAYSCAGMTVMAAAVRATAQNAAALPGPLLQQLLAMLVLLVEAAPTAGLRRQLLQMQLHPELKQRLQLLVAWACGAAICTSSSSVNGGQSGWWCWRLWQCLLGLLAGETAARAPAVQRCT